jgi:hypothetical protein
MNSEINYQTIGYIKTPFTTVSNMPIQPCGANGAEVIIKLNPDLTPGLFWAFMGTPDEHSRKQKDITSLQCLDNQDICCKNRTSDLLTTINN